MKNNLSETDNEIYTIAAAHAICKVDSDYWFISRMNRCLYRMNLETKKWKLRCP